MPQAARVTRVVAVALLGVAYACLAHYTNTAHNRAAGTIIALTPLAAAALVAAWHARHRSAALALLIAACLAVAMSWPQLTERYSTIYWIEHAGSQSILALVFARTLAAGREPLCGYFARMVHGELSPGIERYTRQLTAAWSLFFVMMAATSSALFFGATLQTWSTFANFLTAPLTALMFVAEYLVRRCLHPDMQHADIFAGIQAFWDAPGR
jgi:uncharacterized membrane protein